MSISARRVRVISVAQTRVATRLLDIVTLTLITITFTLTPPPRSPHPPLRRALRAASTRAFSAMRLRISCARLAVIPRALARRARVPGYAYPYPDLCI